jgi:integrase
MRRATNVATATLQANLFALKVLYMWAGTRGVDLEGRILSGEYLKPHELSDIADRARNHIGDLAEGRSKPISKVVRIPSLEQVRLRAGKQERQVDPHTSSNRLRTIVDFLRWLSQQGLYRLDEVTAVSRAKARDEMLDGLSARIQRAGGRSVIGLREAPGPDEVEALLRAIELDASENPWTDLGLRTRNRLLIHFLYGLGIRRGEALALKIENIDFRGNRVLIARCADDPEDPRKFQPLTKTRDRRLPMQDGLVAMTQQYVTEVRSKFPKARRHPFLFVSHQDGAPLSLVSVNKVLRTLRERVPGVPENLTPHLLRHAWNDSFSRLMDREGVDPAREQQLRSELAGWAPNTGTAASYTRRHTREKAENLSLQLQEILFNGGSSVDSD